MYERFVEVIIIPLFLGPELIIVYQDRVFAVTIDRSTWTEPMEAERTPCASSPISRCPPVCRNGYATIADSFGGGRLFAFHKPHKNFHHWLIPLPRVPADADARVPHGLGGEAPIRRRLPRTSSLAKPIQTSSGPRQALAKTPAGQAGDKPNSDRRHGPGYSCSGRTARPVSDDSAAAAMTASDAAPSRPSTAGARPLSTASTNSSITPLASW